MITWAIARAGYELQEFISRKPIVGKWIDGEKKPTLRQLEDFSHNVHVPFGYLFLSEPLKEDLPFPFFRTASKNSTTDTNLNVYDTVLILKQRQDWLHEYLANNDFVKLNYVGKYNIQSSENEIVRDIRTTLKLSAGWASEFQTWQEALDVLVHRIEDAGIIVTFNGIVENNTRRPITVDECRGFVLVDDIAPFMFVNNSDSKSAQMFTIVHELAHIWLGQSAGFDFKQLLPANDPLELLCDRIAAEFLVPKDHFEHVWQQRPDFKVCSKYFKVSEIVIARRALDLGKISRSKFISFYQDYINREVAKRDSQESGGDFYATTRKRISMAFAAHVNNALKSGQLLYLDAYRLTSLKGNTFEKFFAKHF